MCPANRAVAFKDKEGGELAPHTPSPTRRAIGRAQKRARPNSWECGEVSRRERSGPRWKGPFEFISGRKGRFFPVAVRKTEPEKSFPSHAFDPRFTAVGIYDLFYDGKAYSRAAIVS